MTELTQIPVSKETRQQLRQLSYKGETYDALIKRIINFKQKVFNNNIVTSQTPFRLPLGGGSTDLPEYYTKNNGGFWISGAINHYTHIILKNRFEEESKFVWSKTEYASKTTQFTHPILRAVFAKYNLTKHIELVSIGDLPARIGLGSSGTFTVGLLNAIHKFLKIEVTPQQLAEEAYEIERFTLGRKVGKQDQYVATYGGLRKYYITHDGIVTSEPVNTHIPTFEKWLLLFYINQRQITMEEAATAMSNTDHEKISTISIKSLKSLENNNFQQYGQLLDEHWKIKSKYQPSLFASFITLAKQHGAIGGKLCGAGGGGCILLVCPPEHQTSVIEQLNPAIHIPFNFTPFGSEVS